MDVVGVVLRVVVLDQEVGAVQPVIMWPARLDAPRPREMDIVQPGRPDAGPVGLPNVRPHRADERLDDAHREGTMRFVHAEEREPDGPLEAAFTPRASNDVVERIARDAFDDIITDR